MRYQSMHGSASMVFMSNGEYDTSKVRVRIEQLLGIDSILIYRIEGPTLYKQFFARRYHALSPITITSKLFRVESGEIVYHNVVTAHVDDIEKSGWSRSDNIDYHRWSREALDRAPCGQSMICIAHSINCMNRRGCT